MTLEQIFKAARQYANRPNMTDEELGLLVTTLEGILNVAMVAHPRNLKRATFTTDTTDSAGDPLPDDTTFSLIAIPTDLAKVEHFFDANGTYTEFDTVNPPTDRGYMPRGMMYEIVPAAGIGQELCIDYYAFIPPLVSLSDTNWVATYFQNIYVYGLAGQIGIQARDKAAEDKFMGLFSAAIKDTDLQGWNQNIADAPQVRTDT